MKISKAELKKIIAEELEKMQVLPEEEIEEVRKSKMIDGVLYPLPLRLLYKLFGLDEGGDFRDSYAEQARHLLMKKKDNTITPEEEDELVSLLDRFELSEDKNEDR